MDFLKQLRYPGRFIILGRDGEYFVAIYGATGRSQPSLNRRYVEEENKIVALQLEAGGNPELLEYSALRFFENGMVMGNGRQTENINFLDQTNAQEQFIQNLHAIMPEPDAYKTPRITGCYLETEGGISAGLHIVRTVDNKVVRQVWNVPLVPGEGRYIATYNGQDLRPTPSFTGEPLAFPLNFGSAKNACQTIYDLLSPPKGEQDYRVAIVVCYKKFHEIPNLAILNHADLIE